MSIHILRAAALAAALLSAHWATAAPLSLEQALDLAWQNDLAALDRLLKQRIDATLAIRWQRLLAAMGRAEATGGEAPVPSPGAAMSTNQPQFEKLASASFASVAPTARPTGASRSSRPSSTAGALWGLAANPGEFAKVKADPSLIPSLVDESIRWMSSCTRCANSR